MSVSFFATKEKGLAAAGAFWGKYTWRTKYMTFWVEKAVAWLYTTIVFQEHNSTVCPVNHVPPFLTLLRSWSSRFLAIISGHLFSTSKARLWSSCSLFYSLLNCFLYPTFSSLATTYQVLETSKRLLGSPLCLQKKSTLMPYFKKYWNLGIILLDQSLGTRRH